MTSLEVKNFINNQQQQGKNPEEIRQALLSNGWEAADIEEAFAEAGIAAGPDAGTPATPGLPPLPADDAQAPASFGEDLGVQMPADGAQPGAAATQAPAQKPVIGEPEDIFDIGAQPGAAEQPQAPAGQLGPMAEPAMDPGAASAKPAKSKALSGGTQQPVIKEGLSTKTKIIGLVVIIALLVAIAGSAVYAYYHYYQSPERVANSMFENAASLKSASYSVEIRQQLKPQSGGDFGELLGGQEVNGLLLQAQGATTILDPDQSAGYMQATVQLLTEGDPFTLDAEVKYQNGEIYVKLGELPDNAEFMGTDLGMLEGQWIRFDQDLEVPTLPPSTLPGIDSKDEEGEIEQEDITIIQEAFRQHPFVVLGDKINSEKVQGTNTSHYYITIDQEKYFAFLDQVQRTGIAPTLEVFDMIDFAKKTDTLTGEIWVGKKDFQPYKLLIKKQEDDSATVISSTLTVELWDHNKAVSTDLPTEYTSLEEVLASIAADMSKTIDNTISPDPQDLVDDFKKDTDGDGLTDLEEDAFGSDPNKKDTDGDELDDYYEQIYETDPLNEDTDGDGYLDGEETANGYNPNGDGKLPIPDAYTNVPLEFHDFEGSLNDTE